MANENITGYEIRMAILKLSNMCVVSKEKAYDVLFPIVEALKKDLGKTQKNKKAQSESHEGKEIK